MYGNFVIFFNGFSTNYLYLFYIINYMKNLIIILILLVCIPVSYAQSTSGTVGLTILPSVGEEVQQAINEENQQNIVSEQEKEINHENALDVVTGFAVIDFDKTMDPNKIMGIIIFIGVILFAIGLILTRKKYRK